MTEEPVTETPIEKSQKEELRQILEHIDNCIPALTSLHFTDEEKEMLKQQISLWRWYISHGWFPKPFQEKNKPPLSWLLQQLKAFPNIWICVSKLAAPDMPDSLDLEQSAAVLKHQLRRITEYPGDPVPIPTTFFLPFSDPKKTDQSGIPWAKSECAAAKKWRKAQAKKAREFEKSHALPRVFHHTPEEVESYLKLQKEQRIAELKKRADAETKAIQRWEEKKKHGNKA